MVSSSNGIAGARGSLYSTLLVLGGAVGGAVVYANYKKFSSKLRWRNGESPAEVDYSIAHGLVWNSIGSALGASMMYIGDRLGLYSALREACAEPGSSVTAIELAEQTGLHQRWLREWLAQQTGMGVLTLLEGTGDDDASLRYRIPRATAEVLADPSSKEYDIAMIQTVPALVHRAKTMLPLAFSSGIGRPYDEPEVAQAIDRSHIRHVRDVFLPQVLPIADDGRILELLQRGCTVADLGCGGGGLIISMAKAFPKSTFHGYEISKQALDTAAYNLGAAHLTVKNVFFHDANEPGESLGDHANTYDVITTFDVLHDCTQPAQLISQVKTALKPNVGVWLLADIPSAPTVRENLKMPGVGTYYSFSTCLCMACGLSEKGGLGLGTLGFSIPVAKRMLTDGGFSHIEVLLEKDNARWFFVH